MPSKCYKNENHKKKVKEKKIKKRKNIKCVGDAHARIRPRAHEIFLFFYFGNG